MIRITKTACIIVIVAIISMICITVTSNAATISKTVSNEHLIPIPEKPLFITIAVTTKAFYDGTYTDKNNKRNFTKHKETVSFSSVNAPYLVNQLKTSIGFLQFSNPSKKCNHIKCKCSFFMAPPMFSLRHYCSNTKVTCTKGGSAYCEGGYIITGGSRIVSKTIKYSNLAK